MKSSRRVGVVSITILAVLLGACSGTAVRTSDVTQLVAGETIDKSRGREISASASGVQLFAVIPIAINSRQARAFDELKKKAGGDYLSDIAIDESWTYAFVGTIHTTTLTATAFPKIRVSTDGTQSARRE